MKNKKYIYGLVGRNISYSFSPKYFKNKFKNLDLKNYKYKIFDLENIKEFEGILDNKNVHGLNVTIPYKEEIIPFLDKLNKHAKIIGAVNTITISKKGKTTGYNTDFVGFKKSLQPLLMPYHNKALILGTGGASKAVAYALKKLNIEYDFVSRTPNEYQLGYHELNKKIFNEYQIIINTTPIGTHPNVDKAPDLDYSLFTNKHIAYDLVYNPEITKFLSLAQKHGAVGKNGYEMLELQAEKAWKIWNE
ncbi:shikimate dehydrogenase [Flavobacterium agricola]|uniref:Shikimate dehydrogenase n=1 Tax=Flavobacterium agricola TaxID=2870839 RepID=A0ABY6LZS3_9FLAO|nr:shikimate dehydrogenase [Flavobacterium agricola]UYW00403.1 shikimate dehydrogenase [Flavobacterium agricola]